MRLNNEGIKNKEEWVQKGYELPVFDRAQMHLDTQNSPVWVHFGPGNIFHAYHAVIAQNALNNGDMVSGIVCGEFYNEKLAQIVDDVDSLCIHAEIKSDGKIEKRIVASVAATYFVNKDDGFENLKEVFKKGSIDSLDQETLFTIQKFFENNLNVSETSRKLFVHRNTLVYRLEKIKKLTGLDLREFEDAIVFKVALMVKKYLTSSPTKY